MSLDEEIRKLEREAKNDPGVRGRLQAAWVRAGLGWHGEQLPVVHCEGDDQAREGFGCPLLVRDNEPGVYVHAYGCKNPDLETEFVYVKGGEVATDAGRVRVEPFYVSRYPVTKLEVAAWHIEVRGARAFAPNSPSLEVDRELAKFLWNTSPLRPSDPVWTLPETGVTLAEASDFATWAGLRLLTPTEWLWAAYGPDSPCSCVLMTDVLGRLTSKSPIALLAATASMGELCVRMYCGGTKRVSRRYPWGDEPPSREHCVWAGSSEQLQPVVREVVEGQKTSVVPARPDGASWCGAQDMVGNAGCLTSTGQVFGSSFQYADVSIRTPWCARVAPSADIGFRVCLSAKGALGHRGPAEGRNGR